VTLDPFISIDDFALRKPAAFLDHPHRGFESATFVLPEQDHVESRLLYYDSTLGQEEKSLGPGGLVRMICGKGISHCEIAQCDEKSVRAINIWINYPLEMKLCEPWSCVHNMGTSEMPIAEIGGVRVIVLQGAYNGMVGTCLETCPTELQLFHATLEPNRNATFEVPSGWNAVLYVINGSGLVNGEEMKSCRRTGKYDAPGKSTCKLSVDDSSYKPNERREFSVSSDRESMEVMFFAGKPIGLPMIWFDINEDGSSGTFVSSDVSEIKDWLEDWTRGINGFEYRDHWISPGK